MEQTKEPPRQAAEAHARKVPTAAAVLDDGTLLEMVYDRPTHRTAFVLWKAGEFRTEQSHRMPDGRILVPFSPANNLLTHDVVLFPSQPAEYGSKAELVAALHDHIHRYVDLSPMFESIAVHYVLLSWLYDDFPELPYIRVKGEPGSGKTRFLLTVGSLCNKPIFASGASTVSPLFRMLDSIRGTLILDEADFRYSDERHEVVKILNNGTTQGFPVLRAEQNSITKEFNPRAYYVFGPKLIATRGPFEDRALESRFLSEQMGMQRLRKEVPISLSADHREEALRLRNKLLLFRLRERGKTRPAERLDRSLNPRLLQMVGPLLAVIDDETTRQDVLALASQYHVQMAADRRQDMDAKVLAVIVDLWQDGGVPPSVLDISRTFASLHRGDFPQGVTPRWIGHIIRRKLGLNLERHRTGYALAATELLKVRALVERFGQDAVSGTRSQHAQRAPDPIPPTTPVVNDVNVEDVADAGPLVS